MGKGKKLHHSFSNTLFFLIREERMNFLHRLLLGVYGGLWRAAAPFLRRKQRLAQGFAERLAPDGWPFVPRETKRQNGALRLWIQAASGGEAWLVHSLVRELEARRAQSAAGSPPHLEILCTTWTRQGLEVLEKIDAPGVRVLPRYFPLDRPDLMRRAFALFLPDVVVLLETELWPGLLFAAREAGVPVLTINGRMTEKSLSAYNAIASFWRAAAPRKVLAVSPDDARRFTALFGGASSVGIMPNIKFDRVAQSLRETPYQDSHISPDPRAAVRGTREAVLRPEGALLCVLASVREEEENLLLPTLKALQGLEIDGAPLMTAVAPRHMHRIPAWQEKLTAAGLPYRLRSSGAGEKEPLPLCLWDTFGELQALYGMADAVFVGGSLKPLGGQNFLEPLAQGIVPLVGPHTENFHWVGVDIFDSSLAVKIAGAEDLTDALLAALRKRNLLLKAAVRERFAAWLASRTGGSAQAAQAIWEAAGLR